MSKFRSRSVYARRACVELNHRTRAVIGHHLSSSVELKRTGFLEIDSTVAFDAEKSTAVVHRRQDCRTPGECV